MDNTVHLRERPLADLGIERPRRGAASPKQSFVGCAAFPDSQGPLCGRRELSLQLRQWQLWKFNGVKNSLCDALALLGKGVRLGVFNSTGVELPV